MDKHGAVCVVCANCKIGYPRARTHTMRLSVRYCTTCSRKPILLLSYERRDLIRFLLSGVLGATARVADPSRRSSLHLCAAARQLWRSTAGLQACLCRRA